MERPIADCCFLCLRHGETNWNAQGRFLGRSDIPLNERGRAQATTAAHQLRACRPHLVVSSPLIRALETARIIADTLKVPLHVEPNLIECDFGSFEGRTIAEVMSEYNVATKEGLAGILPADGESWAALSQRTLKCIRSWVKTYGEATILFVAHDAVLQAAAEQLCGTWFDNQHGKPHRFTCLGDSWTVAPI